MVMCGINIALHKGDSVIPAQAGIQSIKRREATHLLLDPRLSPPWMAEMLETQEQFSVRGDNGAILTACVRRKQGGSRTAPTAAVQKIDKIACPA